MQSSIKITIFIKVYLSTSHQPPLPHLIDRQWRLLTSLGNEILNTKKIGVMFARRLWKNHLETDYLNPHFPFKSPIPKLKSRLSIPKKIRSLILRSLKAFEFLQLSSNLHKIFLFHLKKFMSSRKLIKANNLVQATFNSLGSS